MQQRMAGALEAIEYITSKALLDQLNANSSDVKFFMLSFKSIISERIEKVLMGHSVGSRSDIVDRYLERYPTEKDTELKEQFKDLENTNVTNMINKLTVHQRLGPNIKENGNNINKSHRNNISKKYSALLSSNSEYSNILRPNVPLTVKMQQRMAEALEAIECITSKAILDQPNANSSDVKFFMLSFKSIISQRIEKVLRGHPVGSRSDIIDRYLERYPTEKNTELKEEI